MTRLTRRSFVAGSTAAAIALALQRRRLAAAAGRLSRRDRDRRPRRAREFRDRRTPCRTPRSRTSVTSGLTCVHMTMRPVGTTPPDTAFTQAVINIGQMESEIDSHPDVLVRIRTVADIAAAKQAGRTGLIYGFQDGVAFETDLSPAGRAASPRPSHRPADLQPPEPARRRLPRARERGPQQGGCRGGRADECARHPGGPQPLRPADGGRRDQGLEEARRVHAHRQRRAERSPAQPHGRGTARRRGKGRRVGHLLHAVPQRGQAADRGGRDPPPRAHDRRSRAKTTSRSAPTAASRRRR